MINIVVQHAFQEIAVGAFLLPLVNDPADISGLIVHRELEGHVTAADGYIRRTIGSHSRGIGLEPVAPGQVRVVNGNVRSHLSGVLLDDGLSRGRIVFRRAPGHIPELQVHRLGAVTRRRGSVAGRSRTSRVVRGLRASYDRECHRHNQQQTKDDRDTFRHVCSPFCNDRVQPVFLNLFKI